MLIVIGSGMSSESSNAAASYPDRYEAGAPTALASSSRSNVTWPAPAETRYDDTTGLGACSAVEFAMVARGAVLPPFATKANACPAASGAGSGGVALAGADAPALLA